MSEYNQQPHYGVNYGSQNQTNTPYLPPYPNQYSQPNDSGSSQQNYVPNYDVNAAAYGYNQSMPGFNTAVAASTVPPLPIYQGWNQDTIPLPTYNAPPNNIYNNQNYPNYSQPYPPIPQQNYQPNPQLGKSYNEIDHSNGYAPPNHTPVIYSSAQYRGSDGNGYIDTAHRAVYSAPQDAAPLSITRIGSNDYSYNTREIPQIQRPQSSTSHTPYAASPTEDHHGTRSTFKQSHMVYVPASEKPQVQSDAVIPSKSSKSTLVNSSTAELPERRPQTPALASLNLVENPTRYDSTAEGREDAKLAVLKLYPQKIGYNEIVEGGGVSEEYLKPVFDDLKLSRNAGTPVNGRSAAVLAHDQTPNFNASGSGVSKPLNGATPATYKPRSDTPNKIIEDKIVDGPSITSSTEKTGNFFQDSPTTSAKSATVAEKERTLQMKMEALRKSREERAQKAAAKNASAGPVPKDPNLPPKPPSNPTAAPIGLPVARIEPTMMTTHKTDVEASTPVVSTPPSTLHTKEPSNLTRGESIPLSTSPVQQSTLPESGQQILNILNISQSSVAASISEQPTIPGLFMNQRKRPVAADFDTPVVMSPFKRPFGHSRSDTPLIIDVSESDDEDGDVEMELDSPNDQEFFVLPDRKMFDQRISNTQTPAQSLSFAPHKPAYTPPQVPIAPASQKIGKVEVLRQKEQQIEEMRRKIAEAEAAKAQKKAQRIASGSNTPRPASVNAIKSIEDDRGNDRVTGGTVQAATQIQQSIDNAEVKVNSEQKRLAEAHAVELEKAAELKKQEIQSKQLRRQKIATDLPRVDAEVQEKKRKLEEIRAQMAQMEADVQKTLDDKQKMADELEALSQEAEDQLQSQKERLNELNGVVNAGDTATIPNSAPSTEKLSEQPIPDHSHVSVNEESKLENEQHFIASAKVNNHLLTNAISVAQSQDNEAGLPSANKDDTNPDQVLEAALQDAVRAEADSSGLAESDAMDTEDFYGPEIPNLASEGIPYLDEVQNRKSPNPSDHLVLPIPEILEHDFQNHLPPSDAPPTLEEESDDYEPAEATSPPTSYSVIIPQTSSGDAVFDELEVRDEGEITDEAEYTPMTTQVETSTAQTEPVAVASEADLPTDVGHTTIENTAFDDTAFDDTAIVEATNAEHIPLQSIRKLSMSDDDIEAEDTLPLSSILPPVLTQVQIASNSEHTSSFTPYESPLKHFHAFRFHPEYNDEVPGGYRSLTYSHKIDPNDTFCPWELGGVCNDKTCTYQHFKDVGLPDDAVLSKLGSPDEFMGEQRTLFCDGLKGVLTSLRAQKIRSFDLIAHAVVEHRAKFLGDKSKVLPLEGISV